jgi:hypothetical protein
MICAAERAGNARMIMKFVTIIIQTNSGMRIKVIPRQRIVKAVAITLMAETVLPTLVSSRLRIQ